MTLAAADTSGRPGPRALWPLVAGLALLAALWLGPLPVRAAGSFSSHMIMHMGVVALAAPLLALGARALFPDRIGAIPAALAVIASLVEFCVVWAFHAPRLHDAARARLDMLFVEQGAFLLAGLFLWVCAIGAASGAAGRAARAAGVVALLATSMHMTLLGALLLLSPRPLYACAALCAPAARLTPLEDQQLGGVIMLIVGGLAYMSGGLTLLASILRDRRALAGDRSCA